VPLDADEGIADQLEVSLQRSLGFTDGAELDLQEWTQALNS